MRVGQPEVASWGPNRLDVFVIGTDRALYHKRRQWQCLGTVADRRPAHGRRVHPAWCAASWGPNGLTFLSLAPTAPCTRMVGRQRLGTVAHRRPSAWAACAWANPSGVLAASRSTVLRHRHHSASYHKWWNGSAWGPSLTGDQATPGARTSRPRASQPGERHWLDVFVTGTDSALYHKWWNGNAWGPSLTGYEAMGGIIPLLDKAKQGEASTLPRSSLRRKIRLAAQERGHGQRVVIHSRRATTHWGSYMLRHVTVTVYSIPN